MGRKRDGKPHWRAWLQRRNTTNGLDPREIEMLYDLPEGEVNEKAIGAMRTVTIRAGNSLEVCVCPVTKLDTGARREMKHRKTRPAQERVNQRNTQRRIMRLAEANFAPSDAVLTLTWEYPAEDWGLANLEDMQRAYDEAGVPWEMGGAVRAWKNFMDRVKRQEKRRGGDSSQVKYIYVVESGKENPLGGLPPKYHVHALVHAPHMSPEDLKTLWPFGYVRADRFDMKHDGAARLSRYLTKQRRYERRWGHSRNLKEPRVTVSYRKMSVHRAAVISADVARDGREILAALYPGFEVVEGPRVSYSDYAAGAYIYARLYRRTPPEGRRTPPRGLQALESQPGRGAAGAVKQPISGA